MQMWLECLTFHWLHYSLCRRAPHKPNNNKQRDQIQAPNTGNLQQNHTCLQSHVFACVCVYVLCLVLVCVGSSIRCPDKLTCCWNSSTKLGCSVSLLTFDLCNSTVFQWNDTQKCSVTLIRSPWDLFCATSQWGFIVFVPIWPHL